MRPKPTPPKRPKVSKVADIYRGWEIEQHGARWFAYRVGFPTYELFDAGFVSREHIITTIDEMKD